MHILSAFDSEHAERGVSEIAEATGLHKATAHRIIMTLLNCGFLERAANGERFRLGLRVVELGLGALRRLDVRRVAFPYMQQLVECFDETCDLSIFDRGRVLYVEVVHSEHSLTIAARIGIRLPAHCTASGRVFLAFLPPEVVESVLRAPLTFLPPKDAGIPASTSRSHGGSASMMVCKLLTPIPRSPRTMCQTVLRANLSSSDSSP
jgi:DNA-binding IclR family transcriptional regulator